MLPVESIATVAKNSHRSKVAFLNNSVAIHGDDRIQDVVVNVALSLRQHRQARFASEQAAQDAADTAEDDVVDAEIVDEGESK